MRAQTHVVKVVKMRRRFSTQRRKQRQMQARIRAAWPLTRLSFCCTPLYL